MESSFLMINEMTLPRLQVVQDLFFVLMSSELSVHSLQGILPLLPNLISKCAAGICLCDIWPMGFCNGQVFVCHCWPMVLCVSVIPSPLTPPSQCHLSGPHLLIMRGKSSNPDRSEMVVIFCLSSFFFALTSS